MHAVESLWLNPSSPYRAAAAVHARLEEARERLTGLLGAGPERVVFNSGATEGNNAVFAHWAGTLPADARVGLGPTEHPSVIEPARRYFDGRIEWLPLDVGGAVDLSRIDFSQLAAVSVMAANNETGILNPWQEIATVCRQTGIPYHCDASQWLGKEPLEGLATCDYLTGGAHKFGGPKGVGFLLAAEGVAPLLHGGAQEGGRRAGTEDVAGALAMLAALDEAVANLAHCDAGLRERFFEPLAAALPGARRIGSADATLWNTLSLVLPDFASARWIRALEKRGFLVSSGSACSTGKEGPSHVLQVMGIDAAAARRVVRISSGHATSGEDWQGLLVALLESHSALLADTSEDSSQVISI